MHLHLSEGSASFPETPPSMRHLGPPGGGPGPYMAPFIKRAAHSLCPFMLDAERAWQLCAECHVAASVTWACWGDTSRRPGTVTQRRGTAHPCTTSSARSCFPWPLVRVGLAASFLERTCQLWFLSCFGHGCAPWRHHIVSMAGRSEVSERVTPNSLTFEVPSERSPCAGGIPMLFP